MELTASRLLLVALPVLVVFFIGGPSASDAQRIDSYPSEAGYETRKDRGRGEFPRRVELLQALDFLEEYERGKENDWNKNTDNDGDLYDDEGTNNIDLDLNEIYPLDFDLDKDGSRQEYRLPEYYSDEVNEVDIPPWLAETLLEETQGNPGGYLIEEPDALGDVDDEELLEIALEEEEALEEAEEEAYMEEIEREEEEMIADIVEEEMEGEAIDNILDDIWAEDVLQKDAEEQLKWLLIEEEEKMQREEEDEEDEEDPFKMDYFYSNEDMPDSIMYEDENYPSFLEGLGTDLESDFGDDYTLSSSNEDYVGESLDEEEKEELMEEAEEILDHQEPDEEEDEVDTEMRATSVLQRLIGSLTREAIQEEMEEENGEEGLEDEGEEEADEDVDGEDQTSSVLDAGMGDDEATEIEKEEEEVEKEVYSELVKFLGEEIDQAINDVAEDIIEELNKEKEEESDDEGDYEGRDYDSMEAEGTEDDSQEMTSEGSEVEPDAGDDCPPLQYFIDDCNIVNNYADLGANGYKDLFTGACNRHQLCYACGEYYDVGSKLCDELFKAEMLARCEADDTDCKQRAKYFWLVARNNRIPDKESPPICANTCILSFLVEV